MSDVSAKTSPTESASPADPASPTETASPPQTAPTAERASPTEPGPTAVVLIAHGSPDPDWRRPLEALRAQLARARPNASVALAYLAHPPTLDEVIAGQLEAGHRRILVLAALLSPGGRHVKRDIPEAFAAAQARARARFPDAQLELAPGTLGDTPEVIDALTRASLRLVDERT